MTRLTLTLGLLTTLLLCGGGCRQDEGPEPNCVSGDCAQKLEKVAGRPRTEPNAANLGRDANRGFDRIDRERRSTARL